MHLVTNFWFYQASIHIPQPVSVKSNTLKHLPKPVYGYNGKLCAEHASSGDVHTLKAHESWIGDLDGWLGWKKYLQHTIAPSSKHTAKQERDNTLVSVGMGPSNLYLFVLKMCLSLATYVKCDYRLYKPR